MSITLQSMQERMRAFMADVYAFPWRVSAMTLHERFREESLGMRASSLTFTTVLALVPFFVVALAVFTAFPIFGKLQDGLQRWLVASLVPDSIARQVLGYLTQFSAKASRLGMAGFTVLVVTVLALVLTIDRTLNTIWRVKRLRPLGQRVLIYWAVLTLGPLVLGASLAFSSYVMSASGGLVSALPGFLRFILDLLEWAALSAGLAAIYHYVPNMHVKWRHAFMGGILAATLIEVAKKGLGLYLANVPTYSMVYGTFATLPILLIWIYVAWVVVLAGAVLTAYFPSLMAGGKSAHTYPGSAFALAIQAIAALHQARQSDHKGLSTHALCKTLHTDSLLLTPALETLLELDWVARIHDANSRTNDTEEYRWLLLIEPSTTALAPLLQRLLIARVPDMEPLWYHGGLDRLWVVDVFQKK